MFKLSDKNEQSYHASQKIAALAPSIRIVCAKVSDVAKVCAKFKIDKQKFEIKLRDEYF